MKILYLADVRMPTEKAHGVQIMKTCEALARAGNVVELVVPRRANDMKEVEPFAYYGVEKNFTLTKLATFDPPIGSIRFAIQRFFFAITSLFYALASDADVIYSRDEALLWPISYMKGNTVWESHTGAWGRIAQRVAWRAGRIIVISGGLKSFYESHGVPPEKIVVAHDGVDLEQFEHPESKEAARARLGIALNARVAMYIGRLDGWKGIDTLAKAADLMPAITTVVIGGEAAQIAAFTQSHPHIMWLGFHPYSELADNQQAADILVLPNTATNEIGARFTSPLKLFSYMASGRPMVVSDVPAIREVLDEHAAYFVAPDDPLALASAMQLAITQGNEVAMRAKEILRGYSWNARARVILGALV